MFVNPIYDKFRLNFGQKSNWWNQITSVTPFNLLASRRMQNYTKCRHSRCVMCYNSCPLRMPPANCNWISFFLLYFISICSPWKMDGSCDNEAPKDPGVCQQRYTEQDYEGMCMFICERQQQPKRRLPSFHRSCITTIFTAGHRAHTVYVGVHMPSNRRSHRRHKHHHKDDDKSSEYDRPSELFRLNWTKKKIRFSTSCAKWIKKKTNKIQRKIKQCGLKPTWNETNSNGNTCRTPIRRHRFSDNFFLYAEILPREKLTRSRD